MFSGFKALSPRVRAALQITKVEQFFSFADTLSPQ
jgi:hypothetical protein